MNFSSRAWMLAALRMKYWLRDLLIPLQRAVIYYTFCNIAVWGWKNWGITVSEHSFIHRRDSLFICVGSNQTNTNVPVPCLKVRKMTTICWNDVADFVYPRFTFAHPLFERFSESSMPGSCGTTKDEWIMEIYKHWRETLWSGLQISPAHHRWIITFKI